MVIYALPIVIVIAILVVIIAAIIIMKATPSSKIQSNIKEIENKLDCHINKYNELAVQERLARLQADFNRITNKLDFLYSETIKVSEEQKRLKDQLVCYREEYKK